MKSVIQAWLSLDTVALLATSIIRDGGQIGTQYAGLHTGLQGCIHFLLHFLTGLLTYKPGSIRILSKNYIF
jgi:hypothetical protein